MDIRASRCTSATHSWHATSSLRVCASAALSCSLIASRSCCAAAASALTRLMLAATDSSEVIVWRCSLSLASHWPTASSASRAVPATHRKSTLSKVDLERRMGWRKANRREEDAGKDATLCINR
jgi:hypothetical protein